MNISLENIPDIKIGSIIVAPKVNAAKTAVTEPIVTTTTTAATKSNVANDAPTITTAAATESNVANDAPTTTAAATNVANDVPTTTAAVTEPSTTNAEIKIGSISLRADVAKIKNALTNGQHGRFQVEDLNIVTPPTATRPRTSQSPAASNPVTTNEDHGKTIAENPIAPIVNEIQASQPPVASGPNTPITETQSSIAPTSPTASGSNIHIPNGRHGKFLVEDLK